MSLLKRNFALFSFICAASLLIALSACESEATPFPVDIPLTVTPASAISTSPFDSSEDITSPIRYALAPNVEAFIPDLEEITTSAQIEQLTDPINPEDLRRRFDIAVSFGEWEGATRSEQVIHISLIINDRLAPLDEDNLANVTRQGIDSQAIISALGIPGAIAESPSSTSIDTLRNDLANAGRPDGFDLIAGFAFTPGAIEAVEQIGALGINTSIAPMTVTEIENALKANHIHLAFITWTQPEQREEWASLVRQSNIIDLYALPISYWAVPELKISFTKNGWPLATR